MDDWYNISVNDIHIHGGQTLLSGFYGGSPSDALATLFPEHNWLPPHYSRRLVACECHIFNHVIIAYAIQGWFQSQKVPPILHGAETESGLYRGKFQTGWITFTSFKSALKRYISLMASRRKNRLTVESVIQYASLPYVITLSIPSHQHLNNGLKISSG